MRVLFIHQNFPGQFKHLAPALARLGHEVRALRLNPGPAVVVDGVTVMSYQTTRGSTPQIHPWVVDFETKTIRAEAVHKWACRAKGQGYTPDVVVAHPGWGESLFLKDVWPDIRLGIYGEFFYQSVGADVGFDPEFPPQNEGDACRLRLKNLSNLLHFEVADAGLSPTQWQASTFPEPFRSRITVAHDGIDTQLLVPRGNVALRLSDALTLNRQSEVVTFVNRNLEPYRGYHVFMRALPEILRQRPQAHVLLVGDDDVSYGARPPQGQTWKNIFYDEVKAQLSDEARARIHFVGKLSYPDFVALLQLSTVHVYLTYPFVLSWSLLEAMSVGCAIVASNTQPLHEAIRHGETGRLVDFFDVAALAAEVSRLLASPAERAQLGRQARAFAQARYDLKTVCLPAQLAWVQRLMDGVAGS
ncbi:MAG: glycosyltransferase [Pseudomonadota bacterium]